MKKNCFKKSFELFGKFFITSLFTLGGGYAMVPVLKRKFSKYIDEEKFAEILSFAQSMPGPIAINLAILIGEQVIGFSGILLSVLGVLIPPVSIIILAGSIIGKYSAQLHGFFEGVYASIIGLVLGVLYSIIKIQKWNLLKVIILLSSVLFAVFFRKFSIYIFIFLVGSFYYVKRINKDNKKW